MELISQIAIFVLGSMAIFLVANKIKWGFVLGLLSQPFWFYTAYHNEQWGMFLLCGIYTVNWSLGIWNWFKPAQSTLTDAQQPHTAILHLKEIYNRLRYETPKNAFDYAYNHSADIDVLLLTDAKQQ